MLMFKRLIETLILIVLVIESYICRGHVLALLIDMCFACVYCVIMVQGRKRTLSSEEMAVFYKHFLDKNIIRHASYNRWDTNTFIILKPALFCLKAKKINFSDLQQGTYKPFVIQGMVQTELHHYTSDGESSSTEHMENTDWTRERQNYMKCK